MGEKCFDCTTNKYVYNPFTLWRYCIVAPCTKVQIDWFSYLLAYNGEDVEKIKCFFCFWSAWQFRPRRGVRYIADVSYPGDLCVARLTSQCNTVSRLSQRNAMPLRSFFDARDAADASDATGKTQGWKRCLFLRCVLQAVVQSLSVWQPSYVLGYSRNIDCRWTRQSIIYTTVVHFVIATAGHTASLVVRLVTSTQFIDERVRKDWQLNIRQGRNYSNSGATDFSPTAIFVGMPRCLPRAPFPHKICLKREHFLV